MKKILFGISLLSLFTSCTHESFHGEILHQTKQDGLQACGKIQHARDPLHPAIQLAGLEVLLLKNGQEVARQPVVNGAFCFDQLEAGQDYTLVPVAPAASSLETFSSNSLIKVNQVYEQPLSWTLAAQVACDPDKNRNINDEDLNLIRKHTLQHAGSADPCTDWRFYNKDATGLQHSDQVYQLHFPSLQTNLDLTIYGLTGCNPD